MILRDYQVRAIHDLRQSIASGKKAPVLVAPTGSGKTAIAGEIIRSAREKGKSVLFLAPRRELVYQTCERLDRLRIDYGVIMAGERPSLMPDVQVASVDTLHARTARSGALPPAGLVIPDEAHIFGEKAKGIIDHYKAAGSIVIGLTATPAKTSGVGLGLIYDDLVLGPSVRDLTEKGFLAPARYFVGEAADDTGIRMQAGDYHQGELAKRSDTPELVGSVVENWLRLASGRQTFVYAVNVAHSLHLCAQFKAHGIAAEHLDGSTPHDVRKGIQDRLWRGETQVVVNCQVYVYGIDYPPVSCIVLACRTKSITKYLQMVGRGLRSHEGKADCMILDHAGAVKTLGFADDHQPWSLDGKKIQERKAKEPKEPKEIECLQCHAVFRAAKVCPNCGADMGLRYAKAIKEHEADLVEVDREKKKKAGRELSVEEKAAWFGCLKYHCRQKGWKMGAAVHMYKEKFGVTPFHPAIWNAEECEPTPEVAGWIKHRNIKRAKARQKEAQRATA